MAGQDNSTNQTMDINEFTLKAKAKHLSQGIYRKYHELRQIVAHLEPVLQHRWTKKTKSERIRILLDAWPSMPSMHRPDMWASPKDISISEEHPEVLQNRGYYLWPYINQEDLSNCKNLILMIDSRGRHHPSDFAAADFAATRLGRQLTPALVPPLLQKCQCTMLLNRVYDPIADQYGRLVMWSEDPQAKDWIITGKQFSAGEGYMVLQIQDRLLEFLVTCCESMLRDQMPTLQSQPVLRGPQLESEAEANGYTSRAVKAAEAAYRVPADCDFGAIRMETNRPLGLNEKSRSWSDYKRDSNWERVASKLVVDAYTDLEVFSELHRQAIEIYALWNKPTVQQHFRNIGELPADLQTAIQRIRYYLEMDAWVVARRTDRDVVASLPLRNWFVRDTDTPVTLRQQRIEEDFFDLLACLFTNRVYHGFVVDWGIMVDALQRFVQANPEAANVLSPQLAGHLGNLYCITQALDEFNLLPRWAAGSDAAVQSQLAMELREDCMTWYVRIRRFIELESSWAMRVSGWVRMREAGKKAANVCKTNPAPAPACPPNKRLTEEVMKSFLEARQDLDSFWDVVDSEVLKRWGFRLAGTAVGDALVKDRPVIPRIPGPINSRPVSTLFAKAHAVKKAARGKYNMENIPVEPRTREQDGLSQDIRRPDIPIGKYPPPSVIPVDTRSYRVFRQLFYDPDEPSCSGEVSWNDFIYAMRSSRLFEIECLNGWVWQFKRKNFYLGENSDNTDATIQFSQPYPKGKMSSSMARRYGQRLMKNIGWIEPKIFVEVSPKQKKKKIRKTDSQILIRITGRD
ncbi:hypothetical protein QBC47DRAFT_432351 [Echria macrotheca]|uniref:Uncharacterized protein n=1 Tax=Echria macrotheca TaxID=438768 RepID=A0AAJ0F3V9_9PEZI|nr:hypothetical protein QBC47DRAFT_432351 [Echria macrotheca]